MAKNKKYDIVQAAYELFLEHGYDNSSIKMIAERAGVSQGLIYNFFESKELLFDAALSMAQDSFQSKMIAVAQEYSYAPPEEYIERYAVVILENREEANFILSSALMPKLRHRAEPLLKEYSSGVMQTIAPLFPEVSDELLYNIGSLLLALSDSLLIDGDKERAVRTGVFAVKMFKHYLNDSE